MKPLRAALFAPAINERMMAKALVAGADAVIFDLEDATPLASKAQARMLLAALLESDRVQARPAQGPGVFVRVNDSSTGLQGDDLEAAIRPGVAAVVVPKIGSAEEVHELGAALDRHERAQGMAPGSVEIVLFIETALGVCRCFELIQASPRVAGTVFGSAEDGDLQADLGCAWSAEGTEMLYARSKVLLDTRASGKVPLDGVFPKLGDEVALLRDTRLSARLGYVGRTVIHPRQIEPVRRAYAVPEAELGTHRRIVAAFEKAELSGCTAFMLEGKFIDYAVYHRARRVVDMARLDSKVSTPPAG